MNICESEYASMGNINENWDFEESTIYLYMGFVHNKSNKFSNFNNKYDVCVLCV